MYSLPLERKSRNPCRKIGVWPKVCQQQAGLCTLNGPNAVVLCNRRESESLSVGANCFNNCPMKSSTLRIKELTIELVERIASSCRGL
jgi:hypothetical protein